jgi:hypothetical protein
MQTTASEAPRCHPEEAPTSDQPVHRGPQRLRDPPHTIRRAPLSPPHRPNWLPAHAPASPSPAPPPANCAGRGENFDRGWRGCPACCGSPLSRPLPRKLRGREENFDRGSNDSRRMPLGAPSPRPSPPLRRGKGEFERASAGSPGPNTRAVEAPGGTRQRPEPGLSAFPAAGSPAPGSRGRASMARSSVVELQCIPRGRTRRDRQRRCVARDVWRIPQSLPGLKHAAGNWPLHRDDIVDGKKPLPALCGEGLLLCESPVLLRGAARQGR